MLRRLYVLFIWLGLVSCSHQLPFHGYQQDDFPTTPITGKVEKTIHLINPRDDAPEHIRAIAFDAGGNPGGNFSIKSVQVAGKELPQRDISVPAGAELILVVEYAPRNLEPTVANFGGVESGVPSRKIPSRMPDEHSGANLAAMDGASSLLTSQVLLPRAIIHQTGRKGEVTEKGILQRALLVLTYDFPQEGVLQIELRGKAVAGPNGEIAAPAGGGEGPVVAGECTVENGRACFTGTFAISLPGLLSQPVSVDLSGPFPITINGSSASINMASFPVALFVVEGNGPGEPLEGQPISALSIAVSGDDKTVAEGSFDGSEFNLTGAGFRIRIYLSSITMDDVGSVAAPIDFKVDGLNVTTSSPLSGGKLTLHIETTLGQNPTGNALADPILSGRQIVVDISGTLEQP